MKDHRPESPTAGVDARPFVMTTGPNGPNGSSLVIVTVPHRFVRDVPTITDAIESLLEGKPTRLALKR